ncbi:hypothetical protein B9Z55_012421 [Caenorhabditis nigoni]|uniref:Glycosyltransferase family 92 protein n=1 Tax=Caenorhabditis nigoni TaxID=1611254 RepID=A0A2G5TX84_9PELO|nr:hypothetical protein B9Z55_012421 [Caenorhabditis nigoni]
MINQYRNIVKSLILLSVIGFICLNLYFYWKDTVPIVYAKLKDINETTRNLSPSTPYPKKRRKSMECPSELWNQVHTDIVPNEDLHLDWIQKNISRRDNIMESQIRLLTAFVYPDHISITTTSQRSFGQNVSCMYYDCLREEIENSRYESVFFPMNVIRCPRRIGAKYVSIGLEENGNGPKTQEPIPMIYRNFEISSATDKCENLEKFLFDSLHFIYNSCSQECHQRSKHHSKWVINVDIDERLVILDPKIKSVLELLNGYNDTVGEVGFAIRRIQKTGQLPEKYESEEQILSEMEFLKYNVSSPVTWGAYKTIYRPEKIAAMYYHWAYQRYPGTVAEYVKSDVALIRHYRTTESNILGSGWLSDPNYASFSIVPIEDPKFGEKLAKAVLEKIKYVYDQRDLNCEEIAEVPYQEYKEFGHDIFNCRFRNETGDKR